MEETPTIKYSLNYLSRPGEGDDIQNAVQSAFKAITAVHRIPFKTPLSVVTEKPESRWPEGVMGWYDRRTPATLHINPVNCGGSDLVGVAIHEYAHLLDMEFFGKDYDGMATEEPEAIRADHKLDTLLFTLWSTPQLQALLRFQPMRNEKTGEMVMPGADFASCIEISRYLSARAETFARAYMQWVATRTGDPDALKMLNELRDDTPFEFWTDEQFAPVAAGLDALFEEHGLLVKPRTFTVDGTGRVAEVATARD